MIKEAVEDVRFSSDYKGGFDIVISVPEGEEIA